MKSFLDLCRGLTRPVVTLTLVVVLCAVVVRFVWATTIPGTIPGLPTEVWIALITSFTTAVAVAMAFWFASRNSRPPGT